MRSDPTISSPCPKASGKAAVAALTALLDRVPGARAALPPLATLELGLIQRGLGVVDELPLPALQRMCAQLSSLPVAGDDGLQILLALLTGALDAQTRSEPQFLSTFVSDSQLMVSEITQSEFAAAQQRQRDDQPR